MKKTNLLTAACVASLSLGVGAHAFGHEGTAALAQQDAAQLLEALGIGEGADTRYDTLDVDGESFRFTGYQRQFEDSAFLASRVVYEGLQLNPDGTAIFDSVQFIDGVLSDESGTQLLSIDRITIADPSQALLDALSASADGRDAMQFMKQASGSMTIEGVAATFAGDPAEQIPSGRVSIASMVFDDADGDGLADMSMTNMMLSADGVDDAPGVSASIESASGTGLVISGMLNGIDPAEFDASLMFAKSYDQLQMSNLIIDVGGVRLAMPQFNSAMEELDNGALRTVAEMPSFSMIVDPAVDPQSAELAGGLAMLGYESIDLSYTGSYVYDPAEDRFYTDAPNAFTLRDGGTFDVQYDMSGMSEYMAAAMEIQADVMEAESGKGSTQIDDEIAMEMLSSLSINGMSMSFSDAGLLERGLALFAMQSGVDVETARMQAGGMVALMAMGAGESLPPSVVAQMSQAMMGFIQNGGTIEVGVQPAEPLKFADIAEQGENYDIESLGLTFGHEAP